ncbi:winged helix DNA-binding domain-containing protein [Haloglycomyces albus]|uniref:winged helix DNA-binding domain-containing protein n=1 Tax=Haloglycomyces albus TaxID=526067 RepID=UPI00046D44FF|nr:winged helix DNA-binding domain-containing protein [Haloglycomyces albus]
MDQSDFGRLRLHSQQLVAPRYTSVHDAVTHLGAVQAQDLKAAVTAIAVRMDAGHWRQVVEGLNTGTIVRSWTMRGTYHIVPGEDLPWMLELLTPRVERQAARRRIQLGVSDEMLERAAEVAISALRGGRSLSRPRLFERWEEARIPTKAGCGYHILQYLSHSGLLCFGPLNGNSHDIVLLEEWVPVRRRLGIEISRDEALAVFAERYFRIHGPADLDDFARWGGLTKRDARSGLSDAADRLDRTELDGRTYYLASDTSARVHRPESDSSRTRLLPAFDELVLGYKDRTPTVSRTEESFIMPGKNGVFRPMVVHDSRAVGTWRVRTKGKTRWIEAEPFTAFDPEVETALEPHRTQDFLERMVM